METRTVEQVENWGTRSVADGFAGLRELSNGEFSGAVRAGGAWLFMLNGRIIGIFEGSLDDFEDADGTAYAAPHPSLALLFSMQEQGGETRAKYYTNDTPLTEVDSTLSDGKFTGFVELSENVLSGDYYVAYYGGRSMNVAFVGASEQIVTGDDAFERAADEVGIYEVTDVDVEVIDVPEPEGDDESSDAAPGGPTGGGATGGATGGPTDGGATGGATDDTGKDPSGASPGGTTAAGPDASTGSARSTEERASQSSASDSSEGRSTANRPDDRPDVADDQPDAANDQPAPTDEHPDSAGGPSGRGTGGASEHRTDESPELGAGGTSSDDSAASDAGRATDAQSPTPEPERTANSEQTTDSARTTSPQRTTDSGEAVDSGRVADAKNPDGSAGPGDESAGPGRENAGVEGRTDADVTEDASSAVNEEAEWRETTTIPSLDPDRSDGPDGAATESESGGAAATGAKSERRASSESATHERSRSGKRTTGSGQSGAGSEQSGTGSGQSGAGSGQSGAGSGSATGSATAGGSSASKGGSGSSDDAEARVRKLRKQLEQRKQQVEQLKDRLSTLESERNEFERERDALRQEVKRLEAKLEGTTSDGATEAGRRLTEAEAFDGTNLFVRYRSKGEATLDEAADGKVDRDDVNANLRLEHHTQFEADEASVDGEPFETFLTNSFEYEFASWLVEDLLYEIRDTGQHDGLRDLYEAIPEIDRVDLHGSVSAGSDDEDTRQESFDVIVRDRMGDPLVVADLNGSREPTSGEMMGSLVDAASGVAEKHDELAGAFQVTESFFEPESLETAEAATSGGFLSREKRVSFVKLSRKRGYHLCLVEARGSDFHLNVPEL